MKACLLIGESWKANLGRTTRGDVESNLEEVNKRVLDAEEGAIGGNEIEEMGAIYLLSNLDSPSALSWALLQPLSPILR